MATKKTTDALTVENAGLKKTIESLKLVNAEQLKRLIAAELLKDRVRELEQTIAEKGK